MDPSGDVYDNEQFNLDDDLTRRYIYKPVSSRIGLESCIPFNLTANMLKEGATQLSHIKEPYSSFFFKIFNLASHSIGNKKIDTIVPPQEMKKKKFAEAMAEVREMNLVFDQWYSRCVHNDRIILDIETLFDAVEKTKVVGFRIWIYAKVLKHMTRQMAAMNEPQPSSVTPLRPLGTESSEAVDILSTAMPHSIKEARALLFTYTAQKDKLLNIRTRMKVKPPSAKNQADTALYSLYNFIQFDTLIKCHTNLFRRYFTGDGVRVATNHKDTVYPAFKDSREIMDVQYNTEDAENAANLIKNMYTKEAAMFYHVRQQNVLQEQRNINSYLRATERIPSYDADTMTDVSRLVDLDIRDSALGCYYNDQTTYQLRNEYITPEFLHRMPLPHRIGAILPTRQATGFVPSENEPVPVNDGMQQITTLNEDDDDDDDEDEVQVEMSTSSEEEVPIEDYMYDEAWLLENDRDGKIATRILGDPVIYGTTQVVIKPLGLHQVKYVVTKRRILECRDHGVPPEDLENMTNEVKSRFMDRRSEKVTNQIKSTIIRNGSPCNTQKLLAVHYVSREGSSAQQSAIEASADVEATSNEIYRASTLNYIVANDTFGSYIADGQQVEDAIDDLSQEDVDDTRFRSESGDCREDGSFRVRSNKQLEEEIPFRKRPNNKRYDPEYEHFVANAVLDMFMPTIEKRRPRGNKMEDIYATPDLMRVEDWMLQRDFELRLDFLNGKAFRSIDTEFFDGTTSAIPEARYDSYKVEKRKFIDAAFIDQWHGFFTSPDVSFANEGIRDDWRKSTTHILDGKKCINHAHHMRVSRLDVLPYHQYKIWIYELFSVVLDVHYNQKIMYNNYIAKYHHCRWQTDSTDPKNNIINHGDNMGGKSFILRNVKKTCPTNVGDMLSQITDKAFNVDRNLNDMLIIIEELENKYLGIAPGMKTAGASGESDALTFFKNRLTSGIASVLHFYENEEMGNRRDCKQAKSSCQGSYLCATNARLADADRHLLSRFTLLSVPKCFGDKGKGGPKVGHKDMKHQFGTDERQHAKIYEEHKDVHRMYFFTEKSIKSNVLNNTAYGVAIDSANIMINQILNAMETDYGIKTNDARKRNTILEFARSLCISFACWNALTSPALRHLMYDPLTGHYLGINPRLFLRGVFPYLLVTKDMVIDALTSLSGLWRHDHLKNVLMAVVESTNLTKPISGKYRLVVESEVDGGANGGYPQHGDPNAARAASNAMNASYSRNNQIGRTRQNGVEFNVVTVADHNYVCVVEPRYDTIYRNISKQLGELQISANDTEKILKELSEEFFDVPIRSYALQPPPVVAPTQPGDNTPSVAPATPYGSLVLNTLNTETAKHKIVIIDICPKSRKPRVAILIAYLREQLPLLLGPMVYDLRKLQHHEEQKARAATRTETEDDDEGSISSGGDSDSGEEDDSDEEEEEEERPGKGEMDELSAEDQERMRTKKRKSRSSIEKGDAVEIKTTLDVLIEDLRKAASYDLRSEAPLIKCIVAKYCTGIKDLAALTPAMEEWAREEYASLFSGYVPWDNHVTADHPSPINTASVYNITVDHTNKHHQGKISSEITFFDTVKSLIIQRKGTDPVILPNYAYISPSAAATLSIFDPLIQENDIIKSTQRIYNRSSSWALHEDPDFTCGKAHLANMAYEPLDTDDVRFRCINFPPFHYQIHADYSRTRLEKYRKEVQREREIEMTKAQVSGDEALERILKKEAQDEHIASVMCEYPLCSMLSKVNHQGNIINHMLNKVTTDSVIFHEMLLANSKMMANDFSLHDTSSLKCKKRLEFADKASRLEARTQLYKIYTQRLPLKELTATAKQNSLKMTEPMTQKARVAMAKQIHSHTKVMHNKLSLTQSL